MPPVSTPSIKPASQGNTPASAPKKRNRVRDVTNTVKTWIIDRNLRVGDRLPQESELIRDLSASKGTVREALKVLETEGLVRTRSGPGGGAFITDVEADHASAMLANHFFFKDLSIADIYALRIVLEPLLARQVAEHISADEIDELEQRMSAYSSPPKSIEEERMQRVAELDFHVYLAGLSTNPLLSFLCKFLLRMLRDLAVCQKIYEHPKPELRERGIGYQQRLVEALRGRDGETAAQVLDAHMRYAEKTMLEQEAELEKAFL